LLLVTDVSGQPAVPSSRVRHSKGQLVGPILKVQAVLGRWTLEDGNDSLSRNVGNQLQLHCDGKPEISDPCKLVAVRDRKEQ
jgi:hypothetical protein